jgi:hypothetical protein
MTGDEVREVFEAMLPQQERLTGSANSLASLSESAS